MANVVASSEGILITLIIPLLILFIIITLAVALAFLITRLAKVNLDIEILHILKRAESHTWKNGR
ncbi:hypothetical protein BDV11DRAFT_173701 [Aspergillus similis]